jgi:hypothetical protein
VGRSPGRVWGQTHIHRGDEISQLGSFRPIHADYTLRVGPRTHHEQAGAERPSQRGEAFEAMPGPNRSHKAEEGFIGG